jgi:hypothetical protein
MHHDIRGYHESLDSVVTGRHRARQFTQQPLFPPVETSSSGQQSRSSLKPPLPTAPQDVSQAPPSPLPLSSQVNRQNSAHRPPFSHPNLPTVPHQITKFLTPNQHPPPQLTQRFTGACMWFTYGRLQTAWVRALVSPRTKTPWGFS